MLLHEAIHASDVHEAEGGGGTWLGWATPIIFYTSLLMVTNYVLLALFIGTLLQVTSLVILEGREGQSLVIGGASLVMLEGNEDNPL